MTLLVSLTTACEQKDWRRSPIDGPNPWWGPDAQIVPLIAKLKRAWLSPKVASFLDTREKHIVPGPAGELVTPGELGRAYLRSVMSEAADGISERSHLRRHVPYRREALNGIEDAVPAYYFSAEAAANGAGNWAMVDVDACYWSIASRVTLDCSFQCDDTWPPALGLGRMTWKAPEEIGADKGVRNATLGLAYRPQVEEWTYGRQRAVRNPYFAPNERRFRYAVVHAIAEESVALGLVTWSVDGGAIEASRAEAWCAWLWTRWGLRGSIRSSGPGYIWGPNSWSVGGVETLDVTHGRARRWEPTETIRRQEPRLRDWLAGTLRSLMAPAAAQVERPGPVVVGPWARATAEGSAPVPRVG